MDRITSTRDRLEEILARLAARDEQPVFLKLYPQAARTAADAADARRKTGTERSALDGTIVSVKDLFDVAGEATTAGSAILRTAAPATADAVIVRRLRQAGAVIIGKTNMTEFAFTAIGANPHYGMPGNAADGSRIPGGSSSGAGVSAAEGSSDIAIGSDTGGSVRIPASLNGVVGFKPTASRVPLDGAFPLSHTLDSIGPLARTVAQCAAADAVMAGDEASLAPAAPLSGLRVGIPRGRLLDDLEPAVATAFALSLRGLEAAGARIFDHSIDDLVAAMAQATAPGSIASIEGAAVHADWLMADTSGVDPKVSGPLGRRLSVPAHVYIRMLDQRRKLAAAMDKRLVPVDVLALPTTPMIAPPAARLMDDAPLCERTEGLLLRNPQIANQFDLTAISLPMPAMELPAGIMLIARHGDDRRLLAIAAAVESAFLRIG